MAPSDLPLFDADLPESSARGATTRATVPVLLPLALDEPYTYEVPAGETLAPGDFVVVPLGPVKRIGVVWREASARPVDPRKLKPVLARLDEVPPLPPLNLAFADWVAQYTLAPKGMVLQMMMSARLVFEAEEPRFGFRGGSGVPSRMTDARQRVMAAVADGAVWSKKRLMDAAGVSAAVIDGLAEADALIRAELPRTRAFAPRPDFAFASLSDAQLTAAGALQQTIAEGGFSATLLDGVTGSGKTEVYFEAVAEALRHGERQVLILLPEIALTNQFLERFERRFGCRPGEWHSAVSPKERARVWRGVALGEVRVVCGARSALFLPFTDLGLIVVDEEHDPSFKQDDRVTYQARDMAVVRASLGKIPIVLASATPSVESIVNVQRGRYRHAVLPGRFSGNALPDVEAVDLRAVPPERGMWISEPLVGAVNEALAKGEQALLFLNRRGYAPLTLCRACGHRFTCPQCTAYLVEHRLRGRLVCHHCGFSLPFPKACPSCHGEATLAASGPGIERVTEEAQNRWPDARLAVLSSDLVPSTAALREILTRITEGDVDIVVGTQLVSKGHNFPKLSFVGVVDGDLSLATADPRAGERTFQLLHQVTGRAGRFGAPGRGLIQTHFPDHPVMRALVTGDREAFYEAEIGLREEAGYPPFGRLAALIVSGKTRYDAEGYARALALAAPEASRIQVLGPVEAPLAIIRGLHRQRLLVKAAREADLQAYLRAWLAGVDAPRGGVTLHIDVDPHSFL
ncbi:primosome assembly protein PriA [Rhodomicrobium udaipurense JA643]|uniref:Replication restart protein PriA n=1 Tax=Rhodomicrobium udaipurense TaxID=1202716 RepID=A0A8I1GGD1_9HYPH|nr:primosomal protein N' [Rhodomicrobium udaipurense]KAI94463.1 primosome assembly protein PriA [Rhodomicrobium udaipurense JA643]MBJ7544669.1 primosomal protein N' [Rhodomicrobium udaipurense]